MKRILSAALAAVILLSCTGHTYGDWDRYADVRGHWAEKTLEMAYHDGLMEGYENIMEPEGKVTGAQMVTILSRVLGMENMTQIDGIPPGAWYAGAAQKAAFLGLIEGSGAGLGNAMTRLNAFIMIARAFQLIEAQPDSSRLDGFRDAANLYGEQRQILASLVNASLIQGDGKSLNLYGSITRAELITVLYRLIDTYASGGALEEGDVGGVMVSTDEPVSGLRAARGIWFGCGVTIAALENVQAAAVYIRSHRLDRLSITGGTGIDKLVLASGVGDIEVSCQGGSWVGRVLVGAGAGRVSISSSCESVEITGRARSVYIQSDVDSVTVSGSYNSLVISKGVTVGEVNILSRAAGCTVRIDGAVSQLNVHGGGARLTGVGAVDTAAIYDSGYDLGELHIRSVNNIEDNRDLGISGLSVYIDTLPILPAGQLLTAAVDFGGGNIPVGKPCHGAWYVDGKLISEADFILGETMPANLVRELDYRPDMALSATLTFVLSHITDQGQQQEIRAEAIVELENYDDEYYYARDTQRVLSLVTTGYKGNYTTAWAEHNDYKNYEKEIWINAKGYSSSSEYLIWISIACQRVNIFKGSAGQWELIRSGMVGTGAPGSATPIGVWKTTYKQTYGWTTGSYTVKPVVRFKGGGYAFHSRLYYPNSNVLKDPSIGFPVSGGCIRMYDEDIQFLHDYVPDGTTVVVY